MNTRNGEVVELIPKNCGVKFRTREESLHVIREQLEQLIVNGKGDSFLADVYRRLLERDHCPQHVIDA